MSNFRYANYDSTGTGIDDPNDPGVKLDGNGNPVKTGTGLGVFGSNRLIASRCLLADNIGGGAQQFMTRTKHIIADNCPSLQVVWWNGYLNPGGVYEIANTGSATFQGQIEDVLGNIIGVLTFNGNFNGLATGGSLIQSDACKLTRTLRKGEVFYVTAFVNFANGFVFNANGTGGLNTSVGANVSGECMNFGTTVPNTLGTGGSFSNTAAGILLRPAAILGFTSCRSLSMFGDSREGLSSGSFVPTDAFGLYGQTEPSIGMQVPCMKLAVGGNQAQFDKLHIVIRLLLAQMCTDAILGYGINDLVNARTAAQLLADNQNIAAQLSTAANPRPVYVSTLSPYTDAGNTTPNAASNANRVTYNTNLRLGPIGFSGILDIALLTENGSTGLWTSGTYTTDGLHLNQVGMNAVAQTRRLQLEYVV